MNNGTLSGNQTSVLRLSRLCSRHLARSALSKLAALSTLVAILTVVGSQLVVPTTVQANDRTLDLSSDPRDPFVTPAAMRGRVDFWVDIFARHGKYEVVMHHRNFPQAIFGRFDFRKEGENFSEEAYRKFRKVTLEAQTSRVLAAIKTLATGADPSNELERRVERAMKLVPGNLMTNYREVIANPDMIRTQTGVRDRHAQAIRRAGRYLPAIEKVFVREYGLPLALTRMPFIESSFDYEAYSSVGAAGIWQFMRRTGLQYLTINKAVDERRDPIRATYAAAQYLRSAYDQFGLWPLAVTSYNHGKGGVSKKVRQYGTTDIVQLVERNWDDRPFGFASENFYPALLAAIEIWDRRAELFPEITTEAPAEFKVVSVTKASSIGRLAQLHGADMDSLKRLNYALTDAVWKGKLLVPTGYRLKLPPSAQSRGAVMEAADEPVAVAASKAPVGQGAGAIAARQAQVSRVQANREFAVASYRVKKGDTLAAIAKKYRVPLSDLIEANGNSEDIHAGQLLSIPRTGPKPSKVQEYVVQSGDTLHSISKRFKVSVGRIRELNKLNSTRIVPGQRLIIGS